MKKFQEFEDLNPVIGICEVTLRGLRILPLNMAAQVLVGFEIMTFFLGFFQNFSEKFRIKCFTKLEIFIAVVRLFQGALRSCEL